jgi:uncharacterized membrane protein YiaA
MSWMKVGLFGAIIFGLYYFQQIKMTLKGKGYDVDLLTGWLDDYRKFKRLIENETDQKAKIEYQGILNGLHLALVGLVVIAGFLLFGK